MTNQDQPELPKNEGDAGSDELAELDVDALLDQASSLADEISSEVGESAGEPDGSANEGEVAAGTAPAAESTDVDTQAAEGQADVGADDLSTDPDHVEQELDDLQAVVDSLGVEMSDTSDDETRDDETGDDETGDDETGENDEGGDEKVDLASADDGAADQGDPGSDSGETDGGEGSPSDPPPAEFDLAAAASDLGLDTTDSTKPVGESPGITELSAEELAFDGPPGSGSFDESGDEPAQASGGRLIGRLAPLLPVLRKAEPLALRLAGIVAFVMEKLDRPFGMIGNKIRSILGLLAIATTATAIVVLVISFL